MVFNVISLPHREDRRMLLARESEIQGFNYQIWEGILAEKPKVGVSRAHKQIVRWAKENEMTKVCIGEDDVHFPAADGWKYFLANEPDDYDIYFAGIYGGNISSDKTLKSKFNGLQCYIVHNRFYDTFLSADENHHIDRWLSGKGKFIVCYPMAAIAHQTHSDVRGRLMTYTYYLKGKEIYHGAAAAI